MSATFVLRRATAGAFRFTLVSPTGHVLVTSGSYESRAAAMAAITSVRRNAADAEVVDETRSAAAVAGSARAARPARAAAAKGGRRTR